MIEKNSTSMTMVEMLVQHLKASPFGSLFPNEDALLPMVNMAIEKVLFEPVSEGVGYNRKVKPSLVEEMAKKAVDKLIEKAIEQLSTNVEFQNKVNEEVLKLVPVMIVRKAAYVVDNAIHKQSQKDAFNAVADFSRYAESMKSTEAAVMNVNQDSYDGNSPVVRGKNGNLNLPDEPLP